jgi:hypothetical protein
VTVYVILRSDTEKEAYTPIGQQDAGNDQAAINTFLEQEKDGRLNGEIHGEGDYRAVPKRSWDDKPRPIRKKISFG